MTRYFDLRSTVLVVVGHGILPEEEDRPIADELPLAFGRDQHVFVQMTTEGTRAAQWGMDRRATREAVTVERFLDLVWRRPD